MTRYICTIGFVLGGLFSGCSLNFSATESSVPIKIENLTQHWVHSREEEAENDSVRVFRPDDFKEFPRSWFRKRYIFYEDGTCEWYYLAPNDGHYFRDGTWEFDSDESNVIHIQEDELTVSFRIIELSSELLRMTFID